jgi:Peptidase family M28/PDZ domain
MNAYVRIARNVVPAALLVAACHRAEMRGAGVVTADSAAIRRDIAFLASDALQGRLTGSPGNDSAAAYLARRYAGLGLESLAPGYLQKFVAKPAARGGQTIELPSQNVFAVLRGRDPVLRGQYVVIGAHFDHLGRSTDGALDPDAHDAVRKGADDNASGTAAVLELARILEKSPPRRSILFVNFTGEEEGLLGSAYFADHSPVALDSVAAMLNFDMVGRMRNDKLIVYGVATAKELPALLDSANAVAPLRITAQGDGFGPSDHSSFYAKNLPVLHFFTDLHDDYHRATDVVEKINAAGEARVVDLAARVARAIADRPTRLAFVRTAAPAQTTASRDGTASNVYLGSIPDMAAGDVPGLRLTGVRAGSPADQGGLRAEDVIIEFGGKTVKDIYEYTNALYEHQPGDEVKVVVLRGGERVTLTVKLGRRGG